ncbi:hypothetical protein AK812_SmicGene26702 [Symbiodinium microadriaticum]|uniref:Uncharacterized protein n=1 Tax=Symbiodinium microadriaticum TaxID=2951 RepID=A0A1Q9D8Q5_SYMMI|nr:hypothetical protein AK812_SmicGene26702 [Symbiodinium microadriaticum]
MACWKESIQAGGFGTPDLRCATFGEASVQVSCTLIVQWEQEVAGPALILPCGVPTCGSFLDACFVESMTWKVAAAAQGRDLDEAECDMLHARLSVNVRGSGWPLRAMGLGEFLVRRKVMTLEEENAGLTGRFYSVFHFLLGQGLFELNSGLLKSVAGRTSPAQELYGRGEGAEHRFSYEDKKTAMGGVQYRMLEGATCQEDGIIDELEGQVEMLAQQLRSKDRHPFAVDATRESEVEPMLIGQCKATKDAPTPCEYHMFVLKENDHGDFELQQVKDSLEAVPAQRGRTARELADVESLQSRTGFLSDLVNRFEDKTMALEKELKALFL